MRFHAWTMLCLAAAVLAAPVANAQQPPGAQEEQARAVKGWPGGIVFNCVIAPQDLATEPVKQICVSAAATASALAGAAKVKFAQAPDQRNFVVAMVRDRALGLTVQVSPSDFNAPLAAIVIRVIASRPYSDQVSAAALKAPNAAQNPAATPRAGDVIFWEELVVASGPPAQLGPGIVPAVEAKLRQFYTVLNSAAPAPKR